MLNWGGAKLRRQLSQKRRRAVSSLLLAWPCSGTAQRPLLDDVSEEGACTRTPFRPWIEVSSRDSTEKKTDQVTIVFYAADFLGIVLY